MQSVKGQTLAANEVYIGHGHHSHRHKASKWASPFTVGQHGTVEECLIMYTDYISSSKLAEEIEELIGKRLLSDTPGNMPCIADVLIAMTYYAWSNDSLGAQQEDAKPRKRVQLTPNKWSRRALGLITATVGDAWRAIYSERGSMVRQPLLSLTRAYRWQQQAITETFASYFPEEIFEGFNFKANWADEISREGTQGSWAPCNAFSVKGCGVVVELLKLPSLAVILIFEYL